MGAKEKKRRMKNTMAHLWNKIVLLGVSSLGFASNAIVSQMPHDFVKLSDIDPSIVQSIRYKSAENFLGRPVLGYRVPEAFMTKPAALALKETNAALRKKGYALVVYDAYRPQRAVNAFVAWSKTKGDEVAKALYYPTVPKAQLFALGYLAEQSGHSRGSTVDVTLVSLTKKLKPITVHTRLLKNGETIPFLDDNTVDMGSSFDLFHSVSRPDSPWITAEESHLRELLSNTMREHGFQGIEEEWWHFTLVKEPYPNTYFDFVAGS